MINEIKHPSITPTVEKEWGLWRLTLEGGQAYIDAMLQRYSKAEDTTDFEQRKAQTYNPARAKSAIFEVRNAIFQRLADVKREGGSESYQIAVSGKDGGVDLEDSSMMTFIGDAVLPDLLGMQKVFVCVDMPIIPENATLADTYRPYVYTYAREDVLSWVEDRTSSPGTFKSLLVRHHYEELDPEFSLPSASRFFYRLMNRISNLDGVKIVVTDYDEEGEKVKEQVLDIDEIPVIEVSIYDSLLKEIAHHQKSMLQMASADVTALVKGNFSLYVEQFDPAFDDDIRGPSHPTSLGNAPGGEPFQDIDLHTQLVEETLYQRQGSDGRSTIVGGPTQGRGYVRGTNQPEFINPSPEPALASMKKQKDLAEEIKVLIDLALTGLGASYAAAESKRIDQGGLEAGLSYIGLQLHMAEQAIARLWEKFLNTTAPASIHYPRSYNLKSDTQRREEAKDLQGLQGAVPSNTYQREIAKSVVHILLSDKLHSDTIQKINTEIDAAPGLTSDSDTLKVDIEAGVVSVQTASTLRGYGPEEAEAAKKDHADRAARIAKAQSDASRGVVDMSTDPDNSGSAEKENSADPTLAQSGKKKVRGDAA